MSCFVHIEAHLVALKVQKNLRGQELKGEALPDSSPSFHCAVKVAL